MAFKKGFRGGLALRVGVLVLTVLGFAVLFQRENVIVSTFLVAGLIIAEVWELFYFVERVNRKLTSFFEAFRYSDFSASFTADNSMGPSFKQLNQALNDVMEALRKARADTEEHYQYLQTVVKHVNVGLLSYDMDGKIELINGHVLNYLNLRELHTVHEIESVDSNLYAIIFNLQTGNTATYRLNDHVNLYLQATTVRLKSRFFKLVSMQNIYSELQQKETESWQKLTSVLRHEIMNSITPISSLTATLSDILQEDLEQKDEGYLMDEETMGDLNEGLQTIENRSRGLVSFINAYKDYTTLPAPEFSEIKLSSLLDRVGSLMYVQMEAHGVEFFREAKTDKSVSIDQEQIEMVLINLVKNAFEAVKGKDRARISLSTVQEDGEHLLIKVQDNGPGIIPEAQEKIFMPFYTTKKTGSGIGLSLSRQIMQQHHGNLTVTSEPGNTIFTLWFPLFTP
ncbi:sensor histidine kinase [Xanthovirga aplysinae]|uniref:sensor histidine kinase n=1 Tax=Xanthovirga aplysinae TaxID=2529853 RepID=UPI0012BD387E|nr:ATP-binding protein [Xanthovirga aplysinae]MTI30342.1 GHKL domain-containing protein [Xanthovirga aplysinae]